MNVAARHWRLRAAAFFSATVAVVSAPAVSVADFDRNAVWSDEARSITSEEDLAYASEYTTDVATAGQRRIVREAFRDLVLSLRQSLGEPAVDAWIATDAAKQTLHVRVEDATLLGLVASRAAEMDVVVSVSSSTWMYVDRVAYLDGNALVWLEAMPLIDGMSVDIVSGVITFDVPSTIDLENARGTLAPLVDFPFSLRQSSHDAGDQNRGGLNTTSCTTGFGASYQNYVGFLTAAHCGTQRYFPVGSSTSYTSTLRTQNYGANADIQFRSISSAAYADVWSGGSYIPIRGIDTTPLPGDYLCSRGKASGFRCGAISNVNYKPTYSGACNGQVCHAAFLLIDVGSGIGDSGGPWYTNETAFGIHKGSVSGDSLVSKIVFRPSGSSVLTQ